MDLFHQDFNLMLLVLFIFPSLLLLMQLRNVGGRRKLPPGPFKLPLLGNLHQMGDLPHRSFQALSAKHGPLMFLQLGSVPTLVISSADGVREAFKNHDHVFSARPALYAANKLFYGFLGIGFAQNVEYWREIRKITVSELLSAKKVESFERVRQEEVALTMASIELSSSSGTVTDVGRTVMHLTNDIVCRVTFGRKFDAGGFQSLLGDFQELFGGFSVADFFPWLRWVHKFDGLDVKLAKTFVEMDKFFDQVILEHLDTERPKSVTEDFVDVMLRVQADPTQKISLSYNNIKAVLMDIFIAGTDTSSATVVWTMTELVKNPNVMKKAQDELIEVIGKKAVVEESDLGRLNYLQLIVKEALRLHPPGPLLLPRETTESCKIQGYDIPEKTRVFVNATTIGVDPNIWKNPQHFFPERFIENPVDFKGRDYNLIPFGIGRRGCPGMNFALVLMHLVLANLLHRFSWELPPGVERDDVDTTEAVGLAVQKKIPLCLIARKRQIV